MKLLICLALASVATTITCGHHHHAGGAIETVEDAVNGDITVEATGTRESRTNIDSMEMDEFPIFIFRGT